MIHYVSALRPVVVCLLLAAVAIAAEPKNQPEFSTINVPKKPNTAYKVLYNFCSASGCGDGATPLAGLIQDAAGSLYGTTYAGGANSFGTVFKLDATSHETVLYSFCSASGCTDGKKPDAGLIRDTAGNLYGTTDQGGASGAGTVFKVDAAGHETVLYSFCSASSCADGLAPNALIQDTAGNLYGTTFAGGANGYGTVFKVDSVGHETVLYSFCSASGCPDGKWPYAGLIQDAAGNLYGTTYVGGANNFGTVFKLDATGHETVLYSFCAASGCGDGATPLAGLIQDAAGNVYGTTYAGGANGYGTVFKVDSVGHETVLYTFCPASGCPDGLGPRAGLIQDTAGNLYGTTALGGANGGGTVFKVDSVGHETVLYSFCPASGCVDGAQPFTGLIQDTAGNMYGTTSSGGSDGFGVVFEVRGPGDPFLSFPLQKKHAFTANIISVFDHSSAYQYCENDIVTAYDGEQGDYTDDGKQTTPYCATKKNNVLYGWSQEDGNPFVVNGHYVGDGNAYFLEYDAHPGFDFETVDQRGDGKIPVLAAADGKVICSNVPTKTNCKYIKTPDPCIEGPGEIKIKHSNGYFSIYLHLSSSLVKADEDVSSGQQIGVSGDTGVCGNPHLHFEIRKGPDGCGTEQNCICKREQTNTKSCIPVDPYGWWGAGNDPYKRATNINLWK